MQPRLAVFTIVVSLSLFAFPGLAAPDITGEDYRLFCGYLDALENPKIAKLKGKRQEKAIARMAKMKRKTLMKAVKKVEQVGSTCEEIGKMLEENTKNALESEVGKAKIAFFNLDYSDPSHVVAQVTWRVVNKKKILHDASLISKILADEAVITKTIALRGVKARAKDWSADEAMLWEAKTSPTRVSRVDKSKIEDWADTRYKRFFDGVKTAEERAQ
jgi:hypothetical protein